MAAAPPTISLSTVDIPHARIAIQETGAGQPIVLVHGNPDSGDLWHGIAARLAPRYRCIMPDLPGYGRSTADGEYDLSAQNRGQYVAAVLQHTGVTGAVTVIAHDLGGPPAVMWAVQHPERVRALILINTIFDSTYRWHFWGRVWRTPRLGEINLALMNRPFFALELWRGSGFRHRLPAAHIDNTMKYFTPAMKRMWLRLYRETDARTFGQGDSQFYALLSRVPTLVLWGERDPYIGHRFPEKMAKAGAEVHYFPEYGHWIVAQAPLEVAQHMQDFLDRHP